MVPLPVGAARRKKIAIRKWIGNVSEDGGMILAAFVQFVRKTGSGVKKSAMNS